MSRLNDPSAEGGVMGQAQEQLHQAGQSVRDMGNQLRDTAQQQYEQIRQSAQEYYQQGKDKAMQWEQGLEDYIREQPVKSILIAAAVGCVFGFLWRRS